MEFFEDHAERDERERAEPLDGKEKQKQPPAQIIRVSARQRRAQPVAGFQCVGQRCVGFLHAGSQSFYSVLVFYLHSFL